MTLRKHLFLLTSLAIASSACGDDSDPQDPPPDAGQPDAGQDPDPDAGAPDGGGPDGGGPDAGAQPVVWPEVTSRIGRDPEIEAAVTALVAQMSLAQKVGQMVQPEIQAITPAQVKQYHVGSVLNGGGSWPGANKNSTAADWVALADAYFDASTDTTGEPGQHLGIPVIWGTDAVHGHSNVIGATLFPHNIGLGAANDPDMIEAIARVTAKEVVVTGIDWTFAPTLAVVRDDRWGRTYEGYSEDPSIVRAYGGRIVEGLQGDPAGAELFGDGHVAATAKHFVGDGGTNRGTDQGNNLATEEELRDIHAQGYLTAIEAGAQAVMVSFSSWQGQKMHGNGYLVTDILKGRFHFDGLVVGDWDGHAQVPGCAKTRCAAAINAGVDLIMVPYDWQAFITNTIADVESGAIPMARIDDAVTRILRVKMRLGLFGPKGSKGKPSARAFAGDTDLLGAPDHRALAREAVRKSLVLLKNKNGILPLDKNIDVLVAGKTANNIPNQSGGWTLTWQGDNNSNADFPNAQSIFAGIQEAVTAAEGTATLSADGAAAAPGIDAAVVVIGELPYAEGLGDINQFETLEHALLHPEDLAVIERIRTQAPGVPIVTVFVAGRPLHVNKELNRSDAFVAAWLPGSEGGGIADVLFGDHGFTGKLSYSWPGADCQTPLNNSSDALFPLGFGLTYAGADTLGDDLPEVSTGRGCDETDPTDPGTVNEPLDMFSNGGNRGNFVMRIGGPSNWGGVDVVGPTTTLPPGNEVTTEVVDGRLQASAMRVTWTGIGQVYSQLAQSSPGTNLAAYGNSDSTLAFRVRVDTAPAAATGVALSTHCVYPCLGEVSLGNTLRGFTQGEWYDVAVPIDCFVTDGLDISNVNTPFLIYTDGPMALSIEDIRWQPNTADAAPGCDSFQ